ncbi:MAG: phenylalanine 4-monooxygenase [Gemmatimonadales bacterium]
MDQSTATPPSPARRPAVRQRWHEYTALQHRTWETLYRARMETLRSTAASAVLRGIERVGLAPDRIPDLREVNRRLEPHTGWRAVPIAGFEPAKRFFRSLAARRFPTTITIRPADRLDYVPEPDIFHDVFGHVPLHSDPEFADFLAGFGALASRARAPETIEALARLFWFTIEFGLIDEGGRTRIYGSGLVSSAADAANALGPAAVRLPFDLDRVLREPFAIDRLQSVLFVIDSFAALDAALARCRRLFPETRSV